MDNEKMKSNIIEVLKFYQNLDKNGCFLDDLEERLEDDKLSFEIETLKEITRDWKENEYLTESEVEWLENKLNIF